MVNLPKPQPVSPLIKLLRYAFLVAGILYGAGRNKILHKVDEGKKEERAKNKAKRDAKLAEEKRISAEKNAAELLAAFMPKAPSDPTKDECTCEPQPKTCEPQPKTCEPQPKPETCEPAPVPKECKQIPKQCEPAEPEPKVCKPVPKKSGPERCRPKEQSYTGNIENFDDCPDGEKFMAGSNLNEFEDNIDNEIDREAFSSEDIYYDNTRNKDYDMFSNKIDLRESREALWDELNINENFLEHEGDSTTEAPITESTLIPDEELKEYFVRFFEDGSIKKDVFDFPRSRDDKND